MRVLIRVGAVALLVLIWSLCFAVLRGYAQDRPRLDVALARVCIAEAGWRVMHTGECAAIYDVVRSRAKARGVSEERALFDYAANHFDEERSSRPWVAQLTATAERPDAWPPGLAWPRYQRRWLWTIRHARKVLRGEVASPCIGPVDHWGGAMDDHRAERVGLERVRCDSGVRNHFWRSRARRASIM